MLSVNHAFYTGLPLKLYRSKSLLFALAVIMLLPTRTVFANSPVSVCGESWAPYIYESKDHNRQSQDVVGIHPANFRLITNITDLEFRFSVLPWKRCLHSVENYSKPGDHEIAVDATFSAERAEEYHLVGPLYSLSTAVFYSRTRYPGGPFSKRFGRVVSSIADMRDFSICGLLGWNYESYYLEHGIPRSVTLAKTPAGIQGALSMVSRQRCDLTEIHPVLVLGAMLTGALQIPADITCRKLTGEPENFYLMVSRQSPRAKELVTHLSSALIFLANTRQLKSAEDLEFVPNSDMSDMVKACL